MCFKTNFQGPVARGLLDVAIKISSQVCPLDDMHLLRRAQPKTVGNGTDRQSPSTPPEQ